MQSCSPVGASCGAQSAADALFAVYDGYSVFFRDCVHLAPVSACAASDAFAGVNLCVIVAVCNGAFYSPVIDSSEYAAAAAAAIAHVAHAFHDVADGVDQSDFFGFIQERQSLFS